MGSVLPATAPGLGLKGVGYLLPAAGARQSAGGCNGIGMAEKSYPSPRSGAAGRSYPSPKARGGGWEDQPHVQGVVHARAQEGLEELSHIEGQEGRQ